MSEVSRIYRLKLLKRTIEDKQCEAQNKELELNRLREEINRLNIEYERESNSELSVLLFIVEESLPIALNDNDWKYEYIYYLPFIDEVKRVIKHSSLERLPNTVDLSKCFKNFGMPKYIYPGVVDAKIIDEAVYILKEIIEEILNSGEIKPWEKLEYYLNNMSEDNELRLKLDRDKKI